MKTKSPATVGLPAPFAILLLASLQTRFYATDKEFRLQLAGFKENRMAHAAYYYDHDLRRYEEVGT